MTKQIKEVNEMYGLGLITDIERIVKIQHIKYLWYTQIDELTNQIEELEATIK